MGGQSGNLANGFTYVVPPTVRVWSEHGSTAGGTAVTITGTNFVSGATVKFGSTAATNVVVVNSTTITATTPAGSAGAVTVTVTVSGQSGSLTNGYTYCGYADGGRRKPEQRAGGWRDVGDDHRYELCIRGYGDVRRHGGDERGGGERHDDHGDDAGGSAGAVTVTVTVNGQSGSLTNGYTYIACADGDQRESEHGVDGWRDGGDDHGYELCHGSDGDVRKRGGDERGGGERHDDHGDDAGGERGCGNRDGDRTWGRRAEAWQAGTPMWLRRR